jgi:hypothetical protein
MNGELKAVGGVFGLSSFQIHEAQFMMRRAEVVAQLDGVQQAAFGFCVTTARPLLSAAGRQLPDCPPRVVACYAGAFCSRRFTHHVATGKPCQQ